MRFPSQDLKANKKRVSHQDCGESTSPAKVLRWESVWDIIGKAGRPVWLVQSGGWVGGHRGQRTRCKDLPCPLWGPAFTPMSWGVVTSSDQCFSLLLPLDTMTRVGPIRACGEFNINTVQYVRDIEGLLSFFLLRIILWYTSHILVDF